MLPFIPALILLILGGPNTVDKINVLGTLDAQSHRLAIQLTTGNERSAQVRSTLTCILALTKDPSIVRAVAKLLDSMDEPTKPAAIAIEDTSESPPAHHEEPKLALRAGFTKSDRTRDGPQG